MSQQDGAGINYIDHAFEFILYLYDYGGVALKRGADVCSR